MATYRKRNDRWHVQVRRTGHASQSKSFISKSDAYKWARQVESDMDKAVFPIDTRVLEQLTVADLIIRYRDTVTVKKRGLIAERQRLNAFLGNQWAEKPLIQIMERSQRIKIFKFLIIFIRTLRGDN